LLTPVQMANLAATIANRGHFITPHIVKKIQHDQLDSLYRFPRYTTISPQYYDLVVKGMRGAVVGTAYGATCRGANLPDIEVCGKTGTAQNKGKDHSIFMGFAPMNKPKIAIAVYVENAGFGATWAVPIASVLMEKYLKGTLSPERMKTVDEISNTNLIQYGFKEY
jgi:penicillin-binding protein 2